MQGGSTKRLGYVLLLSGFAIVLTCGVYLPAMEPSIGLARTGKGWEYVVAFTYCVVAFAVFWLAYRQPYRNAKASPLFRLWYYVLLGVSVNLLPLLISSASLDPADIFSNFKDDVLLIVVLVILGASAGAALYCAKTCPNWAHLK